MLFVAWFHRSSHFSFDIEKAHFEKNNCKIFELFNRLDTLNGEKIRMRPESCSTQFLLEKGKDFEK